MADKLRSPESDGVFRAAERLRGKAVLTPLIENETLNERVGARVFLKCETLQHTGSFKFRGAYNRLSQLTADERKRGVLAWSSGNHAQGVALAGRILNIPVTIVMPEDAPAIKAERVRGYGAEIITYDRYKDDRETLGRRIARERGLALAPSYDHADIIEGQGTLALEAAAQAREAGATLDAFVTCCGGGGMTAGCILALEAVSPSTEPFIAEPEGFDETWASIRDGVRQRADIARKTICDAIATPEPGELTLPVMARRVKGGASLSEAQIREAVAFAFKYLKLVVEPGGAAALAAVLSGKVPAEGRNLALTLSGGNVDPGLYGEIIAAARKDL